MKYDIVGELFIAAVVAFCIMCLVAVAHADNLIHVKGGGGDILCEGADSTPVVEVSYEYKDRNFGAEVGIGGLSMILHDTQVETPYTGKAMGRLNVVNYFTTLKYYPTKDLYIGGGLGYYDMFFVENYNQQSDIDDEWEYHVVAGWEFTPNWFLEGKYTFADIDVESNIFPEGILEQHSRLNSYQVLIGRTWEF